MEYERVTIRGRRPIILRGPREHETVLGRVLIGYEVNKQGDDIRGRSFDERKHIIALSQITKRVPMVMNNKYGELEAA